MATERMRQRTILFVDDEEKIRKYFARIFRRDFDVMVAKDGLEGLRAFAKHGDSIGIVVTDQMMPQMVGLELLAEIRKRAPEVITILSTAYSDAALLANAEEQGLIDYYIQKPWDLDRLTEVIVEASVRFEQSLSDTPNQESHEIPARDPESAPHSSP